MPKFILSLVSVKDDILNYMNCYTVKENKVFRQNKSVSLSLLKREYKQKNNMMIKHELKDNLVHISIDKKDFSHRIPVDKIGKAIQWNIGEKGSENIVIKNVSRLTLRLFTQNITDEKFILQFKEIVQEYAPKNNIDWKATMLAVSIQNEYNSRMSHQETAATKMTSDEIIYLLEEKYNLG